MKIATYNVNGITSRLPRVLEWLAESQPDVACLQELKTSDATFPEQAFRAAGYGAVWHGQKGFNGVAVLAKGGAPIELRRGLPGDPDDTHSRYLEARIERPEGALIVSSIYLPNGNPQPGPKFVYKLAWFERLIQHAQALFQNADAVVLAGDYNVVPTNETVDIYSAKSWLNDALLQPETRDAWRRLLAQGWTDAILRLHPDQPMYTFWDYFRNRWERNAGLRIDHLLLNGAATQRLANFCHMRLKQALASRRPNEYAAQVQPMILTPSHSTFPSGHATEAFMAAIVLFKLLQASGLRPYGDMQWLEQLLRLASRIAVNRTIAGVHFPVDSAAGAVFGLTLGAYFVARCEDPSPTYDAYEFDGTKFPPTTGGPLADGDFYWTLYYNTAGGGSQLAPGPYVTRTTGLGMQKNDLLRWMWKKALAEWS